MSDLRIPQNPGIGGLQEFTTAEAEFLQDFAATGGHNLQQVTNIGATTTVESTFSGGIITNRVKANTSGGLLVESNTGADVALFGAGGGQGSTFYGQANFNSHIQVGGHISLYDSVSTNYSQINYDSDRFIFKQPDATPALLETKSVVFTSQSDPNVKGSVTFDTDVYTFFNSSGNPANINIGYANFYDPTIAGYGQINLDNNSYNFLNSSGNRADIYHRNSWFEDTLTSGVGSITLEDEGYIFTTDGSTLASINSGLAYVSQVYASFAGSTTSPTYTFTSDGNTGMYSIGADILGFSVGGGERVRMGTANSLTVTQSGGSAGMILSGGTNPQFLVGNSVLVKLQTVDGSGYGLIGTSNSSGFRIITNNTDRMVFDTSGRVGIGTTSMSGALHIVTPGALADTVPAIISGKAVTSGNSIGASFRNFTGTTGNAFIEIAGINAGSARAVQLRTNSTGDLGIFTNSTTYGTLGTERVTILQNGNSGFGGVTSPTADIHIGAGTATAGTAPLKFTAGTNLTTAENGAMEYNGTNLFFTRTGAVREGVLTQSAVTTEVVVSDTTVTVNIGGVTYKLLAKA